MEKFGDMPKRFKNVFVKNFGEMVERDEFQEIFSKFGTITSCIVMTDETGKSRGFGFAAYEDHESAEKVSFG